MLLLHILFTLWIVSQHSLYSQDCFGFQAIDPQVCHYGAGECVALNKCQCKSGRIGKECSFDDGELIVERHSEVIEGVRTFGLDRRGHMFYGTDGGLIYNMTKDYRMNIAFGRDEDINVEWLRRYADLEGLTSIFFPKYTVDNLMIVSFPDEIKIFDLDTNVVKNTLVIVNCDTMDEDKFGNVFFACAGEIHQYHLIEESSTSVGSDGAVDLAVDGNGNLFFISDHKIYRWEKDFTGDATEFAGDSLPGYVDDVGDQARFNDPKYIVFNPRDNSLFVSDVGNKVIRKVSLFAEVTTVTPSPADLTVNAPPIRDVVLSEFYLRNPGPLLINNKELYVLDSADHRVYKILDERNELLHPTFEQTPGVCFGFGILSDRYDLHDSFETGVISHPVFPQFDRRIWQKFPDQFENNDKCRSYSGKAIFVKGRQKDYDRTFITQTFPMSTNGTIQIAFYFHMSNLFDHGSSPKYPDCGTMKWKGLGSLTSPFTFVTRTTEQKQVWVRVFHGNENIYESFFSHTDRNEGGYIEDSTWNTGPDGRWHSPVIDVPGDFHVEISQNDYMNLESADNWGIDEFSLITVGAPQDDPNSCGVNFGECVGTDTCRCVDGQTGSQCELSSVCDGNFMLISPIHGLNAPHGLASDNNGFIYIANSGNGEIIRVDTRTYESTTVSYPYNFPYEMVMDSESLVLYVTDYNSENIVIIDIPDDTHSTIDAGLLHAKGIALLETYLVVADSGNNQIKIVDPDDPEVIVKVIGEGDSGHLDGNCSLSLFNDPSGLQYGGIYNESHIIYVVDSGNHRIRRIEMHVDEFDNCTVSTYAGSVNETSKEFPPFEKYYVGFRDGAIKQAQFSHPSTLRFVNDNLFVADQGRIVRKIYLPHETVVTEIGTFHGDMVLEMNLTTGLRLNEWKFQRIGGITSIGNSLFISDAKSHQIYEARYEQKRDCSCDEWTIGSQTCICDYSRKAGLKCDQVQYTCFGIPYQDPNVCSGHGKCTNTDECTCDDGRFGTLCQVNDCDGSDYHEFTSMVSHPNTLIMRDGYLYVADSGNNRIVRFFNQTSEPEIVHADEFPIWFMTYDDNDILYVTMNNSIFRIEDGESFRMLNLTQIIQKTTSFATMNGEKFWICYDGGLLEYNFVDGFLEPEETHLADICRYVLPFNGAIYYISNRQIYKYVPGSPGPVLYAGDADDRIGTTDGLLLSARFSSPTIMTVDPSVNYMYIYDHHSLIRELTSDLVQSIAGIALVQIPQIGGDDGNGGLAVTQDGFYFTSNGVIYFYEYQMDQQCACSDWTLKGSCAPCQHGYKGGACREEIQRCFGVFDDDPMTCSGHGICLDINVCSCEANYTSRDCSVPTCYEIPATFPGTCNGHGECIAVDNCTCTEGYMSEGCRGCEAGSYQMEVFPGSFICVPCPLGTYNPNEGAFKVEDCLRCPTHSFADSTGLDLCIPCPAGMAFSNLSLTGSDQFEDCDSCPAGQYSLSGLGCVNCPKGYWQPNVGGNSFDVCISCPIGTYGTIEGSTFDSCKDCPAGFYGTLKEDGSPADSIDFCIPCPRGSWSDTPGIPSVEECNLCPPGSYGKYDNATDDSTCDDCPLGRFSSLGGLGNCLACPVSTFADETGLTTCKSCPGSTTTRSEGTKHVDDCGTCDPGTYASGTDGCIPCPSGTFLPSQFGTSLDDCSPCATGTYASTPGQSSCSTCPAGRYSPSRTTCLPCPPGEFSNAPRRTSCSLCQQGTYAEFEYESIRCIDCDAGFFNADIGAENSTFCIRCPEGYISDRGAGRCTKCPLGMYANLQNTKCIPCPSGTKTNATINHGIRSCVLCPVGTYGPNENSTTCETCSGIMGCPFMGLSTRIGVDDLSSGYAPFMSEYQNVLDPLDGGDSMDTAGNVTKFASLGVIALMTVGVLILLLIFSLIIGGPTNRFLLFNKSDILFQMKHRIQLNESPVKQKTFAGGFFSMIALGGIGILFMISVSDLFFDNIFLQETFATSKSTLLRHEGLYSLSVTLFGKYPNCTDFDMSVSGYMELNSLSKRTIGCRPAITYNNSMRVDSCRCDFICENCALDGIQQHLSLNAPFAISSAIGYEISVPHFDDSVNYILNGTIVTGDPNAVFFGRLPTRVFINLYSAIYTKQPGLWAPFVNLFPFLQPGGPSTSTGLISQLQLISLGDILRSNTLNHEEGGVHVRFEIALSNFMMRYTEELKQTTLNFFAQVSALAGAMISICAALLGVYESIMYKYLNRKKKIHHLNLDDMKDIDPDNDMYTNPHARFRFEKVESIRGTEELPRLLTKQETQQQCSKGPYLNEKSFGLNVDEDKSDTESLE